MAWLNDGVEVRGVGRRLLVRHAVIRRLRDRLTNIRSEAEKGHTGQPRCTTRQQYRFIVFSTQVLCTPYNHA